MSDTSPEAREAVVAALRRLTPSERVALACELSEEVRALAADGIRYRWPDLSAHQVQERLRVVLLGADLARQIDAARMPSG